MRQNACTLAFCVHQLLQFTPNIRKLVQNLALVWIVMEFISTIKVLLPAKRLTLSITIYTATKEKLGLAQLYVNIFAMQYI